MLVAAVEAPDFPQELQLAFVDHRCVVSPEASQRDEPRDLTLDEVLKDGLDSWGSTIGACRARVCVCTNNHGDPSGDAEPVGVSAIERC